MWDEFKMVLGWLLLTTSFLDCYVVGITRRFARRLLGHVIEHGLEPQGFGVRDMLEAQLCHLYAVKRSMDTGRHLSSLPSSDMLHRELWNFLDLVW